MFPYKVYIRRVFNRDDFRNFQARKHIVISYFLRALSSIASLAMIPIVLDYIGNEAYGIWITLSSVIAWIGLFDIGLGNGLRNRFAEALAKNNITLARTYVSTTYAAVFLISLVLSIIFFGIFPFLNWIKILNAPSEMATELQWLAGIIFIFFMLRFNLKLIGVILVADQKPALNNAFDPISNISALLIILILSHYTHGSILYVGVVMSILPVLVVLAASMILYNSTYKAYRPAFKYISFQYLKDLANLGVQFFIIQISVIIIFATDNIIITQLFGPSEVTVYNIAHKYFTMLVVAFVIYISPYWSAFTESWVKKEYNWIRKTMKINLKFWIFCFFAALIMLAISPWFYTIWIGDRLSIPFNLSMLMAIYVIIYNFTSIYTNFINGISKIRLQLYVAIIQAVINIPLSVFFAKHMGLGINGVILATICCLLISIIFMPIQYHMLINNKARGIWNK